MKHNIKQTKIDIEKIITHKYIYNKSGHAKTQKSVFK